MSVIIRLQNLPWNANALDIRRYFHGLSIPDGGVHIIGGEHGDAFIAFSTDEDARQAMLKDGGRISGLPIRLLLSSKTEMQNVIATAKGGDLVSLASSSPPASKISGFYDRPNAPSGSGSGAMPPFLGGGDNLGNGPGMSGPSSFQGGVQPAAPYGFQNDDRNGRPLGQPGPYGRMPDESRPMAGTLPPMANQPGTLRPPDRSAASLDGSAAAYRGAPVAAGDFRGGPAADFRPGANSVSTRGFGPDAGRPPPPDFGRPGELQPSTDVRGGFGRDVGRFSDVRAADEFSAPGRSYGTGDVDRGFVRGGGELRRDFVPAEMGRDYGRPDAFRDRDFERLGDRPEFDRFMGNRPPMGERDFIRPDGRDYGRPDSGRDYYGRDDPRAVGRIDNARDFPPRDFLGPGPDRWRDDIPGRGGPFRGDVPRDVDGAFNRGGPGRDKFDNPPEIPGPRFGGDMGPGFAGPRPPFREPLRPDDGTLPPPSAGPWWASDPRGMDQRFEPGRSRSPPRDRFPAPGGREWHDGGREPVPGGHFPPGDLTARASNLPRTFNYREVRRFFHNSEIPRDGLKLVNDRSGMRTGTAYIRFVNARGLAAALEMNGAMAQDCKVRIESCKFEDFENAVDGTPHAERSRSPRRSSSDTPVTGNNYFVVKRLASKTDRAALRKFFGDFKIAADGGPYLELAFNGSPTGNALVEIENLKDVTQVLALHHKLLNGARVDVISVTKTEFEERTKRARQAERDGGKDSSTSRVSTAVAKDKKEEKSDSKMKETDRSFAGAGDEGRRPAGSDSDRKTYCVMMRGLPYSTTPAMLKEFFGSAEIAPNGIHIVYNRERRATGLAYVEFPSSAEQRKALDKDKHYIGHRYIEIRQISCSAMREEYRLNQQQAGGLVTDVIVLDDEEESAAPSRAGGSGSSEFGKTLCMQNLHSNTQLEDILDFFRGYHPIVDSIKLQYKDGQPTGDGLVTFPSVQEAEGAMRTKNRNSLLGRSVTLSVWSDG